MMKTRPRQDGGGNREAERGCLSHAQLSFEPTAWGGGGRRLRAVPGPSLDIPGGAADPVPPMPSWHCLQPLPQEATVRGTSLAPNTQGLAGALKCPPSRNAPRPSTSSAGKIKQSPHLLLPSPSSLLWGPCPRTQTLKLLSPPTAAPPKNTGQPHPLSSGPPQLSPHRGNFEKVQVS